MHRTENAVHACFPIVVSEMPGDVGSHVSFAVAAILRNDHGRGERVRCQRYARIPHASRKTQKQIRRNRVLEENLPARLQILDILPLAGLLLRERSEEHTSELQSHSDLVCRLLLEKK